MEMHSEMDPMAPRLSIRIPSPPSDNGDSDSTLEYDSSPPQTLTPTATSAKPRELAPFLRQLREMLDHEAPSILRWTPDGRAFEILDLHQMTHVVLPKYFKHAKYASFQRQLNYFHFRKWTKSKSPRCTFANPHFVREAPELTWRITRKRDTSRRQQLKRQHQRQRTRSFEPQATPDSARDGSRHRTVSESQSSDGADLRTADDLLQWIDDQFPSIASLELLDETTDFKPPAWTPYTYQHHQHQIQQEPVSPVSFYYRTASSV